MSIITCKIIGNKIQDTTSNLNSSQFVFPEGVVITEIPEEGAKRKKIGDGVSIYNNLPYEGDELPIENYNSWTNISDYVTTITVGSNSLTVNKNNITELVVLRQPIKFKVSSGSSDFSYSYVSNIASTDENITFTLKGKILSATAVEIFVGNISKLVQLDLFVPGQFATIVGTEDILNTIGNTYFKWYLPPADIVSMSARCTYPSAGTYPTIMLMKNETTNLFPVGIAPAATVWVETTNIANTVTNQKIAVNDSINILVTANAGDAENLTISAIFVIN
jgi:hypothetical protein